jgi:3-methyladenine DNA glycosylase AlkD
MDFNQVMKRLEEMGTAQTRKTFSRHGAPSESMFGVKVADLKTLLKPLKGNQEIALQLFNSGNSDAMYLAGLIADGSKMSEFELQKWVESATWYMISEFTVPWVASENPDGFEIALKWIDSDIEKIAASGWVTLSCLISIRADEEIDRSLILRLINKIENEIHQSPSRVRYSMNNFIISVGGYLRDLANEAKLSARKIGVVYVDMGETACKVPDAIEYIDKMIARGPVKKKKTAKC